MSRLTRAGLRCTGRVLPARRRRICPSVPGCLSGLLDNDDLTAYNMAMQAGNERITVMFYSSVLELIENRPPEALLRF